MIASRSCGTLDEVSRLRRVGQQLVMRHHGVCAVAVFLVALHGFQTAKAAEFAFNRNASGVGHFNDFAGDFNVVVVVGDGLAIGHQGAVHHDRAEA